MVENRPLLTFFTHLILVIGVALVALPVYVTFVASTLTPEQASARRRCRCVPGNQMLENYAQGARAWLGAGVRRRRVSRMMFNSLVTALVIAVGKIAISLISAFAIVYFRFPLRSARSSG